MLTAVPPGLRFLSPATLIATWFGTGLLPSAPGTWAALAALPPGIVILVYVGGSALFGAAVILFLAGWWAAEVYARHAGVDDPGAITVDEVVGQWLVLLAVRYDAWWEFALAFLLFRFFDILKPWPIRWIERRYAGGLGIMLDDIAAAIYAFLALHIVNYFKDDIFVS